MAGVAIGLDSIPEAARAGEIFRDSAPVDAVLPVRVPIGPANPGVALGGAVPQADTLAAGEPPAVGRGR